MPKVTFTMTTGGRLNLFLRTMKTFHECCLDKDLITDWIISDDRSSNEDIHAMKQYYPEFTIHRSPKPGQAANLNNLFSKVKTEHFLHYEDDWETISKGHFIREMFDVMDADPKIKNVILRYWQGPLIVKGDLRYRGHYFNRKLGLGMSAYSDTGWYGYSLNPGLQHLPTVQKLGKYDEDFDITDRYWDRPQAKKYMAMGLRRANLCREYVKHIGELRSAYERNQ
jgi:hypothetical protein